MNYEDLSPVDQTIFDAEIAKYFANQCQPKIVYTQSATVNMEQFNAPSDDINSQNFRPNN